MEAFPLGDGAELGIVRRNWMGPAGATLRLFAQWLRPTTIFIIARRCLVGANLHLSGDPNQGWQDHHPNDCKRQDVRCGIVKIGSA